MTVKPPDAGPATGGRGVPSALSTPKINLPSPAVETEFSSCIRRSIRLTMASNLKGAISRFRCFPPLAASQGLMMCSVIAGLEGEIWPLISWSDSQCFSQFKVKVAGLLFPAIFVMRCLKVHTARLPISGLVRTGSSTTLRWVIISSLAASMDVSSGVVSLGGRAGAGGGAGRVWRLLND